MTKKTSKTFIPDSFPQVVFTGPGRAELLHSSSKMMVPEPDGILIETEYSVVSPGTELACLGGGESWAPLPFKPGYGSVGRVMSLGKELKGLRLGERVFTYGDHARYSPGRVMMIPLPEGIDPVKATFARMAAVSITALRVADVALGDTVAVFGLGLVGNLAAQLFALSGCEVIGIDVSEKRRELAGACGIRQTFAPSENLKEQVASLTRGRMCRCVVEATGVPSVAERAAALAGKQGELILLGSPRGEYRTDLTAFLNHSHLWGEGCITVKGAHEWRFPVKEDGEGFGRFSFEGNVWNILRLIEDGRLRIDPLLTHVVSPSECQSVYDGLKEKKDEYAGVVFDWTKV